VLLSEHDSSCRDKVAFAAEMNPDGHIDWSVAEGIGIITIDRPVRRNALTAAMRSSLLERLRSATTDRGVRVIIITGADGAFCAGGDIHALRQFKERDDENGFVRLLDEGCEIVGLLRNAAQPTIAMISGPAQGAGLFMALGCDLRYCNPTANFAAPLARLGIGPEWGGTYLLTRLIGTARTLEMFLSGRAFDAAEAARIGLVNRVWPQQELRAQTLGVARQMAGLPADASARAKRGVWETLDQSFAETAAYERSAQLDNFRSPDSTEGIAAFLEKRAPRFGDGP